MKKNKEKSKKKVQSKDTKVQDKSLLKKINPIIYSILAVVFSIFLVIVLSPKLYIVYTARWTDWDETNKNNVATAMGEENTEERFRLYFQYYNVLHELGHGLMRYNNGVDIHIVEEEQLVNDFAIAYWTYYGNHEKIDELYDIVTYAVENVGDNYKNGVDYMENAKKHSSHKEIDDDFFNFNDYGWFQFSCVKKSIEQNKSLEEVLKEMGFKNYKLTEKKLLVYEKIDEETSTRIINDAVKNFNEWGLYFPKTRQIFTRDPNNNKSGATRNYLGLYK